MLDRPYLQIPENEQLIYDLREKDNLRWTEIARRLNITTSSVRLAYNRIIYRLEDAEKAASDPEDLHNLNLPIRIYRAITHYGNIYSISELREFVKSNKLTRIEGLGRISEQYVLDQLSKYTAA